MPIYAVDPATNPARLWLGNPPKNNAARTRSCGISTAVPSNNAALASKQAPFDAFAEQQFRQHGYPDQISLVGHSVGAWWHQQEPYIVPTCHQELEAGMVLALEPHVGFWHLQDLVEITSDGPNLLSDRFNTDEMFVV